MTTAVAVITTIIMPMVTMVTGREIAITTTVITNIVIITIVIITNTGNYMVF